MNCSPPPKKSFKIPWLVTSYYSVTFYFDNRKVLVLYLHKKQTKKPTKIKQKVIAAYGDYSVIYLDVPAILISNEILSPPRSNAKMEAIIRELSCVRKTQH